MSRGKDRVAQAQDTQSDDHVDRVIAEWRRERPEIDLAPVAVIARLGRAARYVDAGLERAFAPHGLNRASWDVLAALRRGGPPYERSPTQLYRELMRTSGAMTNRLQRLQAAGLITRVPDAVDARGLLVRLTAKGRTLTDEVTTLHLDNENRLLDALDADERATLAALLKKLLLAFEVERPGPPR